MASHSMPGAVPYTRVPAYNSTSRVRWSMYDVFDENEQERRKKGKEVMPVRPMMSGPLPPPWSSYPGGYGPGAYYAPGGYPTMPYLQQPQPTSVPARPFPENSGNISNTPAQNVPPYDQWPGGYQKSPYVFVQYADLLLRQGDFKGVTVLKDDVMYKNEAEEQVSEELRILRVAWELIQTVAKSRTLDTLSGVPTVFEEAANVIRETSDSLYLDESISSTEIHILALTFLLTRFPVLRWKWQTNGAKGMDLFNEAVDTPSLMLLHKALLRQGRIWDFHDCVVLPGNEDIAIIQDILHKIFEKDLVPSLEMMISQWTESIHGYDASTTLGLLSIMTHIMLEPVQASEKECVEILKLCLPLAISVGENDPSNLKSRPYLRVLLAKSRFAENASRQAMNELSSQLRSAQGVFYKRDLAGLPIYVPSGTEILQWTTLDQPDELKDPIKLILRSAIELGDMGTEALARLELIRLSENPKDEFDMLCALQLDSQGDLDRYGMTLASKYLVSNTKEAREELAISISQFLSRVSSTDCWPLSTEWLLNMLLYKLEGKSPSSIKNLLERSHTDYESMDARLLDEISRKMPSLKDWVEKQARTPKNKASQDNITSPQRKNTRTKRAKGSGAAQPVGKQPSVRRRRSPEYEDDWDIRSFRRSKSKDRRQDQEPVQDNVSPRIQPLNNEQPATAEETRDSHGNPFVTSHEVHDRRASLHPDDTGAAGLSENIRGRDEAKLEAAIRDRIAREFDKKLAAEKISQMKQREGRTALLEELRKEVEAIRKEAVEQAEKKARVEAQERHEQMVWERRLQESKLEKEAATKKAKEAEAEMDAKFEAEKEAAIREREKKIKEELEIRKAKEEEARKLAAQALHEKLEAERKARAEAEAEKKYKEEVERKLAAEKRDTKKRAREEARKQAEEEATRQWAAEQAQKDIEAQNRIHFEDAVGRKFTIPFSEGRKWETMRELIEAPFSHIEVLGP
ncbi:hypothetical protein NPX13_g8520 [Xylaria arbuscula]|uniref:Ubiquitin-like domain-containing protein n=1 Tax=Xylaria arbuscula TaxID=114810 RepID=A0A9W8N8K5_9PEZI|nr:hypothetical protein NPX13_g8520 [Xylaria arbuscula]